MKREWRLIQDKQGRGTVRLLMENSWMHGIIFCHPEYDRAYEWIARSAKPECGMELTLRGAKRAVLKAREQVRG